MNPFAISLLLAFIASALSALFIIFHKPRTLIKRTWFYFNISVALWSFPFFFQAIETDQETSLLFFRLSNIYIVFIGATFVHFSMAVSEIAKERKKEILFHYLYSTIYFLIIVINPHLFITDVIPKFDFLFYAEPGPLYFLTPTFTFLHFTYAFYLLLRNYANFNHTKQNQIKYIFLGSLIGVTGGSTAYLAAYDINFYPYPHFLTPAYVILTTYAMVRHNLMDINIFIRRSLVYTILVTLITFIYLAIVLIGEKLFQLMLGYDSIWLSLIAAVIIAAIFIPLRNWIQDILNNLFFKKSPSLIAKENEKLRHEIIQSERLKTTSVMASGIAHEIKNPLTAIKTFCEYLPNKLDDKEFLLRFSKLVDSEVNRIDDLVHQLLNYAKPESYKKESINIIEVIEQTTDYLSNDLLKHHIKLNKKYDTQSKITINADFNQLKQALLNILMNAIDASKRNDAITVEAIKIDSGVEIIISDTGKGMDGKQLKQIFDPFYTNKSNGTGLGMAIIEQIIKEHRGKISVESKVNEGTSFRIKLPN